MVSAVLTAASIHLYERNQLQQNLCMNLFTLLIVKKRHLTPPELRRTCISSRGTNCTRPLMMVRGSASPTSTCSTYRLRAALHHSAETVTEALR